MGGSKLRWVNFCVNGVQGLETIEAECSTSSINIFVSIPRKLISVSAVAILTNSL